jgi:hypothetical protein
VQIRVMAGGEFGIGFNKSHGFLLLPFFVLFGKWWMT